MSVGVCRYHVLTPRGVMLVLKRVGGLSICCRYFDGGRGAWVIAMEVGSDEVLASACTQADHPAVNTSAWSVSDGEGGFRIDLDVDVVGIDGSVASENAFNTLASGWNDVDKGPMHRDTSGNKNTLSPPRPVPSSAGDDSGAPRDGAAQSLGRMRSPMAQSLARIRSDDTQAMLDEVDPDTVSQGDRSAPHIDERLATLFAICRFDKGSLQPTTSRPRRVMRRMSSPGKQSASRTLSSGPRSRPVSAHVSSLRPLPEDARDTSHPPDRARDDSSVSRNGTAQSPKGGLWRPLSLSALDDSPPEIPSRDNSGSATPLSPGDFCLSPTSATPFNFNRDLEMLAKLQGLSSLSEPLSTASAGFDDDHSSVVIPSPPAPSLV